MKRVAVITVIALAMVTRSWGAGGVAGSPHDFTLTNSATYGQWNTRAGVCSACHSAHHTDEDQIAPLWTHATSTAAFTPYTSPTLTATDVGTPDGASLACLSCHDGTLGVNEFISGVSTGGTTTGPVYVDASAQIGPDLHTTHPISFTYDAALATADGGLENPMVYTIGTIKTNMTVSVAPVPATWSGTSLTGKTIDQAMLFNHKMQCSSCHDVHKMEGSSPTSGILARLSGNDSTGRGSILCRTCHRK
jgi:hypothetical protein